MAFWLFIIQTPPPQETDPELTDNPEIVSPNPSTCQPELNSLTLCTRQLDRSQIKLHLCRSSNKDQKSSDAPRLGECISSPEVRVYNENQLAESVELYIKDEKQRRQNRKKHRRVLGRSLLEDGLDLTIEESAWVSDYICAIHKLRQQAVEEFSDGTSSVEETLERIRQERGYLMSDLKDYLGVEGYTGLRKLGGIGLLNDTLECGEQNQ